MRDDLFQFLGLVRRSGKIVSGSTLLEQVRAKKVAFVLIAEDASERTKKQISDKCSFYEVPYFIEGTSEQISSAVGLSNRMAIGLNDRGFAKKMMSMLKNEGGSKYEK